MQRRSLLRALVLLPGLTLLPSFANAEVKKVRPIRFLEDLCYKRPLRCATLADGFACLEMLDIRVEELRISPTLWEEWLSNESHDIWGPEGFTGVLWGAKVIFHNEDTISFHGKMKGKYVVQKMLPNSPGLQDSTYWDIRERIAAAEQPPHEFEF